jgi:hypothetical protein
LAGLSRTLGPSPGRKERHRFQDLVFHVDEGVLFKRDAPVGLPLRVRLHGVAALFAVGEALVLPEMHNPAERADMRDEKAVGFALMV